MKRKSTVGQMRPLQDKVNQKVFVNNSPSADFQKFELFFDGQFFEKKDVLNVSDYTVEVLSTPKPHYTKWYWKVLNFLTFKLLFNVKYTYTVKIV